MSEPVYRLEGLTKIFDGTLTAVNGVDLTVRPGEKVAVIGPSGAGKTTLFRLLNLTVRQTAGRLWIAGQEIGDLHGARLREMRRKIGTVYQQHNLVPRLRVIHNVLAGHLGTWSLPQALRSLVRPREEDLRAAHRALSQVGIPEKLWARTDELSGGQQQRVAIARVLLQNPEVILADEPVSSVDPTLAHGIVKLLVELCGTFHKTLVMNLHSVDLALAYFPRIIGFRDGQIVFDRSPAEISDDLLTGLYAGRLTAASAEDSPDAVAETVRSCTPLLRPQ
ncbi:MAG: phosphonate ABC transporter ATP-binding protein [candidate division NC10 bacterium]|nr:phosphonate ABC transporter ATP-binding protein [candidate division NC10 bacterium]MBI2454873.1 phosphonate ABC transporter ATP-binding protein [candidate division NC10 bacterium]MBI3085664.1 phosphonate ABC transporter ATP-binding protein [candidate division NC10 bacterium]